MPAMQQCSSCEGPVPQASRRCPWCYSEHTTARPRRPEHLFATFEGQTSVLPPPDLDRRVVR